MESNFHMSNTLQVRTGEVIKTKETFGSSDVLQIQKRTLINNICRLASSLDENNQKEIKKLYEMVKLLLSI